MIVKVERDIISNKKNNHASSHADLIVVGWVPVRIKHNETVGPDEVQPTTTGLTAQHENKIVALKVKQR